MYAKQVSYRHWTFPNDPVELTPPSYMMARRLKRRRVPCPPAPFGGARPAAGSARGGGGVQSTCAEPLRSATAAATSAHGV